jgi:hypothetical protein
MHSLYNDNNILILLSDAWECHSKIIQNYRTPRAIYGCWKAIQFEAWWNIDYKSWNAIKYSSGFADVCLTWCGHGI